MTPWEDEPRILGFMCLILPMTSKIFSSIELSLPALPVGQEYNLLNLVMNPFSYSQTN